MTESGPNPPSVADSLRLERPIRLAAHAVHQHHGVTAPGLPSGELANVHFSSAGRWCYVLANANDVQFEVSRRDSRSDASCANWAPQTQGGASIHPLPATPRPLWQR